MAKKNPTWGQVKELLENLFSEHPDEPQVPPQMPGQWGEPSTCDMSGVKYQPGEVKSSVKNSWEPFPDPDRIPKMGNVPDLEQWIERLKTPILEEAAEKQKEVLKCIDQINSHLKGVTATIDTFFADAYIRIGDLEIIGTRMANKDGVEGEYTLTAKSGGARISGFRGVRLEAAEGENIKITLDVQQLPK